MLVVLLGIGLGYIGTALGGLITVMVGKRSDKIICGFLSFAGGIMCAVSVFELIPESIEMSNAYVAGAGIIAGVITVMLLNKLVDYMTEKQNGKKIHETLEELHHQTPLLDNRMFRSGIFMLIVITLHNIPEGLAIGAAGSHEAQLGIMIAVIMALHNIPEGMAVSAPLLSGGMKRGRIMFWTALSGLPTIVGAIMGFYLGGISEIFQAVCLSVAGGAMLYIVFGEIIPQSVAMAKSRIPTVLTLAGIVVGLLITRFH